MKREKDCVVYPGMTSEKVYSIVQRNVAGMALSGQRFAWNLFFLHGRRDITIEGVSIIVDEVTPDEIRLRVA